MHAQKPREGWYALAGMDNKLFVKKYQLELPKKEEIGSFWKRN